MNMLEDRLEVAISALPDISHMLRVYLGVLPSAQLQLAVVWVARFHSLTATQRVHTSLVALATM